MIPKERQIAISLIDCGTDFVTIPQVEKVLAAYREELLKPFEELLRVQEEDVDRTCFECSDSGFRALSDGVEALIAKAREP